MKQLLTVAGLALLFSACSVNYEKTKSGIAYKIFKGKGGEKLKGGEYVKFNADIRIVERDTVLNTTAGRMAAYAMVDTSRRSEYSLMEIISKCSVGDSTVFILNVDSLIKKNMIDPAAKGFKKDDRITFKIKVLKAFKNEQEVEADYKLESETEKNREIKEVEKYLADKGIKAEKTKNGAFVEIQSAGDTLKAQPGKEASVMYRGYLMTNNTVFDTNMDSTKGHTDPYTVQVGSGGVIPGWEEALPYFGKGGKGRIFVPAMLAYGMQARPEIPAYSNLIFDIEVKNVAAPAMPQQAPAMPGLPGGGKGQSH